MNLKRGMLSGALALALPALFSLSARAAGEEEMPAKNETAAAPQRQAAAGGDSSVFTLGQISVTAHRDDEQPLGTATLDREELWDFSRDSLKEALDILPGVSVTTGAGNRNEAEISIRGFSRYQVPLLMDGIRLYLPADNRIDVDRFLTPDLSEIQVSKGYVSVLNGPDGMGGAINLVTRKPVKPFEAEVRASALLGGKGQYNGYTGYTNLGGRQERYYYQVSFEQRDIDHWRMSNDYKATPAERGGDRDHTGKKDWRVNLKAGFTPNATDEYSLNFVKQEGEKHGIGAVTGTSTISAWDWPKWNTWSLYWLSHTELGDESYVNTKAYYNRFENDLVAYTNVSLSARNWTSHYDDNAKGVSVEFGTTALPRQTLKAALHFRRDDHTEWQVQNRAGTREPKQDTVEDSYSFALEDTWHVTPKLDLVGGVSRDIRRSKKSEDYANDVLFEHRTADRFATNVQGAAIYRYSDSGTAHFSASRRYRFPTMFERFSSRFGGALSNPYVRPERALNLEIGVADDILPGLRGEAALFHSKVKDAIHWVNVDYQGGTYQQSRNIGEATFKGVEMSLYARVSSTLEMGGNYTYIDTEVDDPNDPAIRLTTTPRHKAFAYARWQPVEALKVIPNIEHGSPRWSAPPAGRGYVRTGGYTLLNLKLEYRLDRNWDVSLSARNLLDKNYELSSGYPEAGRNFMLSARFQL